MDVERQCRCGCGESVPRRRVFVNMDHQLTWMVNGGAAQLNAMQSLDGKVRGGTSSGMKAAKSGRLVAAGLKGAEKLKKIAEDFREQRRTRQQ